MRSPGESVAHERETWSAPSPNFASSVRASTGGSPVARMNASRSGSSDVVRATLLGDHARDGAATERARPRRERQLAEQRPEERRLAGSVPAGHRDPLTGLHLDVERADGRRPARDERAVESSRWRGDATG